MSRASALPDARDTAALLALGQAAVATDAQPVRSSGGAFPAPRYPPALTTFFRAAAQATWSLPRRPTTKYWLCGWLK